MKMMMGAVAIAAVTLSFPVRAAEKPVAPIDVPAQSDGIILVLGTEIKEGHTVVPGDVIVVKIDGTARRFRRLKVGDHVEEGQVIARIDDGISRAELAVARAQLAAAAAKKQFATKLSDEAVERRKFLDLQNTKSNRSVPVEEFRAAQSEVVKFAQEVLVAAAQVKVAEANLRRSEFLLARYEVRAVRGVVAEIVKRRGEGVRALDTVVRIRPDDRDR